MKKLKLSWLGLLAFSLLIASCCHDDDDTPVVPSTVVKQPTKITAYSYSDESNTPSGIRIAQFKYNTDNSIAEMNDNGQLLKFIYNSNGLLTEIDHYANETSSTVILREKITYDTDKIIYREEVAGGIGRDYNIFVDAPAQTVKIIDAIADDPLYSEILFNFDSKGNIKNYEYLRKSNGVDIPVFIENLTYDNTSGVFSKVKLSVPWTLHSFWSGLWDIELRQTNNVTSSQTSADVFTEYSYDYDADGYPIRTKVDGRVIYEFEYTTVTP